MGLTVKQELFYKEYLIDLNATQAAIRAKYSKKTAYSQGQRLLKNVEIKKLIEKTLRRRSQRIEITADKVLQELGKLAFSNMDDYMEVTEDGQAFIDLSMLTIDQAAAISEITVDRYTVPDEEEKESRGVRKVKLKLSSKQGALDLLAKHFHLLNGKDDADTGNTYITNIIASFNTDGNRELTGSERGRIGEAMGILEENMRQERPVSVN